MIILLSRLSTEKWVNNGNTRPPALCAGEAPNEKLKNGRKGNQLQLSSVPSDVNTIICSSE